MHSHNPITVHAVYIKYVTANQTHFLQRVNISDIKDSSLSGKLALEI